MRWRFSHSPVCSRLDFPSAKSLQRAGRQRKPITGCEVLSADRAEICTDCVSKVFLLCSNLVSLQCIFSLVFAFSVNLVQLILFEILGFLPYRYKPLSSIVIVHCCRLTAGLWGHVLHDGCSHLSTLSAIELVSKEVMISFEIALLSNMLQLRRL